jgi:hypothetical protein
MNLTRLLACAAAAGTLVVVGASGVLAGTTFVVTPANQQGWSTADTRPGGNVTFVADPTSPFPAGALQLTTDATTTAKAQYLHAANSPLSSVTEAGYYTKQVSGSATVADPSYQLVMCLSGGTFAAGTCGFSTLVFEPYQNPLMGPIVPNAWQQWNVASGFFWSTQTVTCSNGTVVGTPGGPANYTIGHISSMCPSAVVIGFGVNIGSNNPGYVVVTDGFNFNGTTYDFQVTNTPTSKEQCKHGGFVNFTDAQGHAFTNQGHCVSFVENHHDQNGDQNGDQGGDQGGDRTSSGDSAQQN